MGTEITVILLTGVVGRVTAIAGFAPASPRRGQQHQYLVVVSENGAQGNLITLHRLIVGRVERSVSRIVSSYVLIIKTYRIYTWVDVV